MNPDNNLIEEPYLNDPNLLIELCRGVLAHLESQVKNTETTVMETQLREISRAITKLENQSVSVPDALRSEKIRLAATLSVNTEATQKLHHLINELMQLLNEFKSRLEMKSEVAPNKKGRKRRSKTPKTEKSVLRQLIIDALRYYKGSASKQDVLKYLEEKLQGKLLPGDLEWREASADYAWQNNACWERNSMKNEGIIKEGSPRGVWELSEDYL